MNLMRNGKLVSEQEYMDKTESKQKCLKIIDKLSQNTMNLQSMLPANPILEPKTTFGQEVKLKPEMKKYETNNLSNNNSNNNSNTQNNKPNKKVLVY